jgi:hypothetical protein
MSTESHQPGPDTQAAPSNAEPTGSTDLRFLEERLANLEAQVAVQQHPPPYIHEGD